MKPLVSDNLNHVHTQPLITTIPDNRQNHLQAHELKVATTAAVLTKLNRRLEHEHGSERLKKRKGRLRKYRQKSAKRHWTLRYTIQPLPEIHFKTHHCPRTGAYSSIPAVQAPTIPPHHNDSPLSPSPSVEQSELQEVARKGLRLRSQDES
ncbi:hypothetical protein Bca4012_100639 [Brassica carinata]